MIRKPILEVKELNKSYGKDKILKGMSFELFKGEIVGLIGPNGSGKSTTMKCISNLVIPDSGNIKISGFSTKTHLSEALSHLFSQIEHPGLYENLSGYENLQYFKTLYGKKIEKSDFDRVIEFIDIGRMLYRPVRIYSMGMKQRISLGIAMMISPDILILDEPMNGLDPTGVFELRESLKEMKKNGGTILVSSHQLEEIMKICDRILFISDGAIIGEYDKEEESKRYKIYVSDTDIAKDIVENLVDFGDGYIIIELHDRILQDVISQLNLRGVSVIDIENESIVSIDKIYTSMFGGNI